MRLAIIERSEAPKLRKDNRRAGRMAEYDATVASLVEAGVGKAGRIELEEGENQRGVKLSIKRAAKRMGVTVRTWDDGTGAVYAAVKEDGTATASDATDDGDEDEADEDSDDDEDAEAAPVAAAPAKGRSRRGKR